ncbi:methyltransferase [Candidatus Woesearchaeota archaeon]|nr:methyltransferase [Candidatus Woesearchaeota archaeon]MBT7929682.1 methyltransferase [Candidatus Peregrinibacteria bacterium]MBT3538368.1 methyltransferase [Candidatus Woesearchaeota archaeon]MBT4698345.1 methyltransferase [Candidatus Woesearchaeota archaeon]MBT4717166.1 methyltransferase [Candidatus Woesearchaeota archaeon]
MYEPREDSFLLEKYVKKLALGKVLDVGTGSGIQALTASRLKKVKSVLAVDINQNAVDALKHTKLKVKISNLFSNVKGEYDTIIFNAPYLPNDPRVKDLALDGGKNGYEVTERFLNTLPNHLSKNGITILLISSLTKKEYIESVLNNNLLSFEILEEESCSFEIMYVYKIWKNSLRLELEKKGVRNLCKLTHGKRGNIFTGQYKDKRIAVKAKREESDAMGTINREFKVLNRLNRHNIGPNVLFSGDNYFAYDFIPGKFILDYFENSSNERIITILKNVMKQMRTLDKLGFNKEEMHHPYKHVIIGKRIALLDFERCVPTENPHNVTQFCQFLISNMLNNVVSKKKIKFDKKKIIALARKYKAEQSEENFKEIFNIIK